MVVCARKGLGGCDKSGKKKRERKKKKKKQEEERKKEKAMSRTGVRTERAYK